MAEIYKSKFTGEEIEELLDSAKEGIPSINPNYGIDVGLPTSIVTPPGGDHLESNANITIFTKVGDVNKIYTILSRVLYPFISSDDISINIVGNRITFTINQDFVTADEVTAIVQEQLGVIENGTY